MKISWSKIAIQDFEIILNFFMKNGTLMLLEILRLKFKE